MKKISTASHNISQKLYSFGNIMFEIWLGFFGLFAIAAGLTMCSLMGSNFPLFASLISRVFQLSVGTVMFIGVINYLGERLLTALFALAVGIAAANFLAPIIWPFIMLWAPSLAEVLTLPPLFSLGTFLLSTLFSCLEKLFLGLEKHFSGPRNESRPLLSENNINPPVQVSHNSNALPIVPSQNSTEVAFFDKPIRRSPSGRSDSPIPNYPPPPYSPY